MTRFTTVLALAVSTFLGGTGIGSLGGEQKGGKVVKLHPGVQRYVTDRAAEFDQISLERKEELGKLVSYIKGRVSAGQPVRLTFVCTHNSRRSQMAQTWAAVAAVHYRIPRVEAYSGGTETTALNPRAVTALEQAGLRITKASAAENPVYSVQFAEGASPLICFSKLYGDSPNPSSDFCAVMTCSHADQTCPQVIGAAARIAIPYDDPKEFDGTSNEATMYAERSAQIAREMLYAFSCLSKQADT